LGFGVWGFVFGVWVLGPNPQSPIPNPQSPFTNYQLAIKFIINNKLKKFYSFLNMKFLFCILFINFVDKSISFIYRVKSLNNLQKSLRMLSKDELFLQNVHGDTHFLI
jgi:hypothetical protein